MPVVDVQLRRVEPRRLQKRCAPLFAELVDELLVCGVFPGVIEQAATSQSMAKSHEMSYRAIRTGGH